MRKPAFCICENKDADQLCGNRTTDQRLCFRYIYIVQSIYFLNPKFQALSHLQWLYSPVCVGPGLKPRRPVFSRRSSMPILGLNCRLQKEHVNSDCVESNDDPLALSFSFTDSLFFKMCSAFVDEATSLCSIMCGLFPGLI